MKRITLAALAPLTLALVACNGDAAATGEVEAGDPIAAIPAPEGCSWIDVATPTEDDGVILGNPDAPIKLVEYGSFTCGACAMFTQQAHEALKNDYVATGRVSYELRNLDRNGIDTVISALTRCGPDETFHPLADQVWLQHDAIMTNAQAANLDLVQDLPESQRWVAVASETGLINFFAERGLSRDAAATCLADYEAVLAFSERTNARGEELGVSGTPTFFVNGTRVDGTSWSVLEPILQRAGARDE